MAMNHEQGENANIKHILVYSTTVQHLKITPINRQTRLNVTF